MDLDFLSHMIVIITFIAMEFTRQIGRDATTMEIVLSQTIALVILIFIPVQLFVTLFVKVKTGMLPTIASLV